MAQLPSRLIGNEGCVPSGIMRTRHEASRSSPAGVDVKNEWRQISTPQHALIYEKENCAFAVLFDDTVYVAQMCLVPRTFANFP